MKRLLLLTALSALLVPAVRARPSPTPSPTPTHADCSFSHPQLPGRCNVTVPVPRDSSPQHACDAVLRCLNGTLCREADRYCLNPGVAKTWKLEQAIPARPRVSCGYSSPTSSGWCWVTAPVPDGATPQQACEAVVPCMNGQPCEGYIHPCDPDTRSGWRLEQVRPVDPPPAPRH